MKATVTPEVFHVLEKTLVEARLLRTSRAGKHGYHQWNRIHLSKQSGFGRNKRRTRLKPRRNVGVTLLTLFASTRLIFN